MLTQLIYVSVAASDFDDNELERILETSVSRNSRDGLTGLLLFSKGTFMQVLEGESDAIDDCLKRIESDPRHHSLTVLVRTQIQKREFKAWNMGFRRLNPSDTEALPNFAPYFESGFIPEQLCTLPDGGLAVITALAEHADGTPVSIAS